MAYTLTHRMMVIQSSSVDPNGTYIVSFKYIDTYTNGDPPFDTYADEPLILPGTILVTPNPYGDTMAILRLVDDPYRATAMIDMPKGFQMRSCGIGRSTVYSAAATSGAPGSSGNPIIIDVMSSGPYDLEEMPYSDTYHNILLPEFETVHTTRTLNLNIKKNKPALNEGLN